MKRVQKWSTEESYLLLKKAVVPIRVVMDRAKRSLRLKTDDHIDKRTRSENQKFCLYREVIELRSRMKKICEKKGLSNTVAYLKQLNDLF